MSSYPSINMFDAPQTYSYRPPQVINVQEEAPAENENILVQTEAKTHPMALLAEELDHPSQSLPFLELFEKSAKKVEDLGNSLKKVSVGLGVIAVVFFGVAVVSFFSTSVQAMAKNSDIMNQRNKKLSAGLGDMNFEEYIDQATGNISISAISSTISMFMWGLIMAKAKTGFTAAFSKDALTVQSSFSKMIGMGVLIVIAGLAKLNADGHYVESFVETVKIQAL